MGLTENEKRLWWQAYLATLAGCYACPDQDSLPASASGDAIRAAKMAVEDYREFCGCGGWYCEHCQLPVQPEHVTNDERHDERAGGCGNPVTTRSAEPAWTGHARVELLGHRSYLGRIREVERYGARLGEVQELLASGEYGDVHQFGGKSVYEIRSVSLEDALTTLRPHRFIYCFHCGKDLRTIKYGEPGWDNPPREECLSCSTPCGGCRKQDRKPYPAKCTLGIVRKFGKACDKFEAVDPKEQEADADLPFDDSQRLSCATCKESGSCDSSHVPPCKECGEPACACECEIEDDDEDDEGEDEQGTTEAAQ